MVTLVDFIGELLGSVLDLVVIFLLEVALTDPLSFVSFLIGAGLTTFAIGLFAYLALGALVDAIASLGGGGLGSRSESGSDAIGRAPPQRRD